MRPGRKRKFKITVDYIEAPGQVVGVKIIKEGSVRGAIAKMVIFGLIMSLNWTGLSAVIGTFAYFGDAETSSENSLSASSLDFSLSSEEDFSPDVTPTQSSSRDISVINDGSLGFEYTVEADNFSGDLCDSLDLAANLNEGASEYTGSLTSFYYNADEFTAPDDWQFTVSLTDDDPSLENQTCVFNFVFNGIQIGGFGFSDQEIISNTVTSGSWEEEEEITSNYSPIADAYVDQNSPGANHGDDNELKIRSKNPGPENKRIFIRFDFNFPVGTAIISSDLKLYMKSAPSASRTYEAKRALGGWKERDPGPGDGIDWNNQPSVDDITDSVSSGDATPKWLSWNVTSDMQDFVDGTSNYGWRLSDNVESSPNNYESKFHSRESSDIDKRPILEITFTPPEVTTAYPVINEVYYDVGSGKGNNPNNEWVEIYNPTSGTVDISGWKICEASGCDTIPSTTPIPAHGFAVASGKSSTWEDYWILPAGAITIDLDGDRIGSNGLHDDGDRVILKDTSDTVIDAMSYGNDISRLNPSVPLSGEGKSLARIVKGYDANLATDWIINATPNPGTNPSVGGIETIAFTYQGVEFLGSEPTLSEDGISNNLLEKDDLMNGEILTMAEEPTGEETIVIEEIIGENLIIPEGDNEIENAAATTEDIIEDTALETDESATEKILEEAPVIEEQPVTAPENIVVGSDAPEGNDGDGNGNGTVDGDGAMPVDLIQPSAGE